jgi:hypothetical protein
MPAGSVFDAYVDRSWKIYVEEAPENRVVDLTSFSLDDISAELLYDRLAEQEKPKYFEFLVIIPDSAPRELVIDRINGEPIKPLKLKPLSEDVEDDEATINATVRIKTLIKKFQKGINTIEIAYGDGDDRVSTEVVINIQI